VTCAFTFLLPPTTVETRRLYLPLGTPPPAAVILLGDACNCGRSCCALRRPSSFVALDGKERRTSTEKRAHAALRRYSSLRPIAVVRPVPCCH